MDHRIRNLILATLVIIGISIDQTLANEKHHSIAEQAQSSALPAEKMALAIPVFTLQINALNSAREHYCK